MSLSVFNMFSIGIGPSSSHTVGPMRAARMFLEDMKKEGIFPRIEKVKVDLYGSLALTGLGHGTDKAVVLGLMGHTPAGVDPEKINSYLEDLKQSHVLNLFGEKPIAFFPGADLIFHMDKFLPYHPNGIRFLALGKNEEELSEKVYYSVGGGFVVPHEEAIKGEFIAASLNIPFPYTNGDDLLRNCRERNLKIPEFVRLNERALRSDEEIDRGLLHIWQVMDECIASGIKHEGILPGGLFVERRAKKVYEHLHTLDQHDPARLFDWVSLWALAVNEENAAGSRVVTAPTNGASGTVPAVLKYYTTMTKNPTEKGIVDFMLTAGATGILFKIGASISAAEMGCMGEVGVASAMAAAGLTAALGGTNIQIENAAEIGIEHHLGLTCDPVKGLVQIPCIERNTMGAMKAITAAHLALASPGRGRVTLDQAIATMRETGINMKSIYKETSLGGLAANVPEC